MFQHKAALRQNAVVGREAKRDLFSKEPSGSPEYDRKGYQSGQRTDEILVAVIR